MENFKISTLLGMIQAALRRHGSIHVLAVITEQDQPYISLDSNLYCVGSVPCVRIRNAMDTGMRFQEERGGG